MVLLLFLTGRMIQEIKYIIQNNIFKCRNCGGLSAKPTNLNPDVIIDCVGGQDIEDASRQALGNRGHFVTIMGPGSGAFGDGGDGAKEQMVQGMKIASRSVTSNTLDIFLY